MATITAVITKHRQREEGTSNVNPRFYIDFSPFKDADCWIDIRGKSMGRLIAHGDKKFF